MPELVSWVLSLSAAATGAFGLVRFFSGESPQVELPHGIAVDIGFALATTLPLTLWLLGRNTGPRRILVLCLVGVITLSVLLTLSRGALVGLGAGAVWLVVVDRRHTKAVLATMVAAVIAVGLAVHFEGNRIDYGLRAKHKVAAQNIRSRLAAWHAAADFAVDRPLLGIGPGNFAARYRQVAEEPAGLFVVKVVHNAYLDVAAELGLVAMLIFLAYLGLTLRRLLVADRLKRGPPGFASALAISLVVGIFAAVTLSEQYFAPFWLIGGLAAALWHAPGADEQVDEA
jgi:O-antigen ligase